MMHLLSARQLDGNNRLRPLLREAVHDLLRRVSGMAEVWATAAVGRASFAAMMGVQWHVLGEAGRRGGARAARGAREAVGLALKPNVSDFFPALAAADLQGVRRLFGRRVARMIDEQIERRMLMRGRREAGAGRSSGEKDLLDVMLDMSSEHGKDDGKVTINRDVIRTFLTEELRKVLGSKAHIVEHSDVDRLPYL
nr:unnamed protein product [Digitaria exilis]